MPEAIARAYREKCESGKLSAKWKSFKEKRGLTCSELGEAVASIVENKMKSKKEKATGGEVADGELYEEEMAFGGHNKMEWVKIAGPHTKVLDRRTKQPLLISDIAHLVNYKKWVNSGVKATINHNFDKRYDLNIQDVRYDPDEGLWVLPLPSEKWLRDGLYEGLYKPSIEVKYNREEDLKDGELQDYDPYGVGLMTDHTKAMEPTAGVSPPPMDALTLAQGGKDMTDNIDDQKKKQDEENAKKLKEVEDAKKAKEAEEARLKAEKEAKEKADQMTAEEKKALEQEEAIKAKVKADLEKEYTQKLEALSKEKELKVQLEKELVDTYLKKLPKPIQDLLGENPPLDKVKEYSALTAVVTGEVKDFVPTILKDKLPDNRSGRDPTVDEIKEINKRYADSFKYRVAPNPGQK